MTTTRASCLFGALSRASAHASPSRHASIVKLGLLNQVHSSSRPGSHSPAAANVPRSSYNPTRGHVGLHTTPWNSTRERRGTPGHTSSEPDKAISCHRCGEPGHVAAECSSRVERRACLRCGKAGHLAKDCPHPVVCFRCGEPGHSVPDCPSAFDKRTCRRCGETGHVARDCLQPKVCYRCGQPGHNAASCPRS